MRLKQLKLSGFKSFVDPTAVAFPGQLLAVVGPNGCGKSNIIDAVRWVLGESSAKNLRGESMADVIFNGSSQRKAVGQAAVELIFENNLGRLSGALTSYAEIAIKRVVTRDGESSYFLNGSRCRKRDITDIFLGTGANARGYSIIGQGTISRIIEAKPEAMRMYLEEAAGVSKYKERRKETLQRIKHTRENLARVSDIRDELDKQLQRLERQAKAAERYTLLKEEETLCRAEISALKWRDLSHERQKKQQALQQLSLEAEKQQTELTLANKNKTLLNEQCHEAEAQFQEIQSVYYQMATEIARLEESLVQQQKEKKRLENDSQQLQNDLQQAERQYLLDQQQLQSAGEDLALFKEKQSQLQSDFEQQTLEYKKTNQQQETWKKNWQALQTELSKYNNELENSRLKLEHIEQRRQDYFKRMEKLQADMNPSDQKESEKSYQALQAQQSLLSAEQQRHDLQQQSLEAEHQQSRAALLDVEKQLNQTHDRYQQIKTDLSALQARQQAAFQSQQSALPASWAKKSRLIDQLKVDKQWQFACEMVMQDMLHAVVIDSMEELSDLPTAFKGQCVTMYPSSMPSTPIPSLADKIEGLQPAFLPKLETVFAVDSFTEAQAFLPELNEEQSVITRDGYWLGAGWLRVMGGKDAQQESTLARQENIAHLEKESLACSQKIEALRKRRDQLNDQLEQQSKAMEQQRAAMLTSHQALLEAESRVKALQARMQQEKEHKKRIQQDQEEAQTVLEELAQEKLLLEQQRFNLRAKITGLEQDSQQLQANKMDEQRLHQLRSQHDASAENLRQLELDIDREKIKIQQYTERKERGSQAIEHLKYRMEALSKRLCELILPEQSMSELLPDKLAQHQDLESSLNNSREQLAAFRSKLDEVEKVINHQNTVLKKLDEQLAELKMEEQALAVKADALLETLAESKIDIESLQARLPENSRPQDKENQLLAIIERIKRLGAINLAAIEEFQNEAQRKSYLDEQYDDLNEALNSLEQAIEKMDSETRARLKQTFEEVNQAFKSLFPKLFGGGKAQLELTCDNLLEAGVVVMAQPPGKRNSSIHLLSGGEKAMTAVALVFAIFQLNPSPFCMLDEVDAPLDDVNVGRFCDLVKEMSEYIQFLFITHNKITMELADQLIGVTMREPGVSRLVAVDMQQALSME